MAATVTTRLPNELNKELDRISKAESLDKSAVMRRLLASSIQEWKVHYALDMYSKRAFSTEQAAHFMGVSLWRFGDMLKKYKTPMSYDVEEFNRDLRNIKKIR